MDVLIYFYIKNSILLESLILHDTYVGLSEFNVFRVDRYFDFISINTRHDTSHKYAVNNGKSMFSTTS